MLGSSIGKGDNIRLRLLSGTSGLNSTLHHWREERASYCPWADCHNDKAKKTVHYFCLECPHCHKLRERFREGLRDDCRCWPPKVSYSDFFDSLNDDERILFMLSMPVRGRETRVDVHSEEYVRGAYAKRKCALNSRYRPEFEGERPYSGSEDEG
jgi:hypothetical protein